MTATTATCTLRHLHQCLSDLGLDGEEAALAVFELVRQGDVRLVGDHADALLWVFAPAIAAREWN
ncbi:MAG: hypothetical protein ACQGVC_09045 [Myxococcota bacterium]